LKISVHSSDVFFLNLETNDNHWVPAGQENMVDCAFLQIRIQVQQLVQHVIYEGHSKVGYLTEEWLKRQSELFYNFTDI